MHISRDRHLQCIYHEIDNYNAYRERENNKITYTETNIITYSSELRWKAYDCKTTNQHLYTVL